MNKFFMTLSLILALPSIVLSSDKPEFSGFLPGYDGSQLPIQYLPGTTDTRNLKEMSLITAGVIGTGISFSRFPKTTTATLFGLCLWKNETVREYPTTTALALAGAACIWAFCKTKELFKEYTYATELTQDQDQIEAYQITAFIKQNPRITITTTRTADLRNLYQELDTWITTNKNSFNIPNQTLIIETSLKLKNDYVRRNTQAY